MKTFRVTGDFTRMVYSEHSSEQAALKAARALSRRWGVSHLGSEPRVERLSDEKGWVDVAGFNAGRAL
jgi:ribosomal protein L20A (L18A)